MGLFSLKSPGKSNFIMKFVEVMNNVIFSLEVIQPSVRPGLQFLRGLKIDLLTHKYCAAKPVWFSQPPLRAAP